MFKEIVYRGSRKIDENRYEELEIKALVDDKDALRFQIWSDIEEMGQMFFDYDEVCQFLKQQGLKESFQPFPLIDFDEDFDY